MARSEFPFVEGAVVGAVAYVVGYVVTYLWQVNAVRDTLSGLNALISLLGGETIPAWKAVGWVFYSAHMAPLRIPTPGAGSGLRSLIGNGGAPSLLYVVPPLVLLVAGAAVAYWAAVETPGEGLAAGVTVASAYLVLVVVGVFVFQYSMGDVTVGSDLARSVVLAGIVYPVGFGAIGGGLYGATR